MNRQTLLIILCLYFIGFFFRIYQLERTGIYPDEITWMVKGKEAIYALGKGNLSYYQNQAWWNDTEDGYAISWPMVITNGLSHVTLAGTGKYSLHLFSDLYASRLPLILIGPLTAVAIYLFGRKFIRDDLAAFIALLYTLNPLTIALDRWLLNDSYLTLFSFLSITSYLSASSSKKTTILPGIWLSLSFLTKPQGLLPVASWLVVWLLTRSKFNLRLLLANLASFFVLTTLIWPQSWFDPIFAIPTYLFNQFNLANHGDPIPNFYFGATSNPHWSYYLFQIFTRVPEPILILLVLKKPKLNWRYLLPILSYFLINLVFLSIVAVKGGFRYNLPLLPWIYLAAGFSLQLVILKSNLLARLAIFGILAISILVGLTYHPNYYLYYNQFIGGPKVAQKYDLVGLCLGSDEALRYLDREQIEGVVGIIGCQDTGPYNTARTLTKDWSAAEILILESSYAQQYPNRPEVTRLTSRQPIYTVIQAGVVTARVYR